MGLVLAAVAFYLGDTLVLHFRQQQTATVKVRRMYAILLKGNKIDYEPAGTEMDTCVNSALPHMGYPPCWYLQSHRDKQIDM